MNCSSTTSCSTADNTEVFDLIDISIEILKERDGDRKSERTLKTLDLYTQGRVSVQGGQHVEGLDCRHASVPLIPGRNENLEYVTPGRVKRRGKGGTLASRQSMLHSLVHIESCAIDLAWDIIARFGTHADWKGVLPEEFYVDFLIVAADEARHYQELKKRLRELGMEFGELPVHDGLWESALNTKDSLPARLAIEHCTHEARGLDVLPQTIDRFRKGGDEPSAALLENVIYPEEITHCAAGVKYLTFLYGFAKEYEGHDPPASWITEAQQYESVEHWFHGLVRQYFHGLLKPPFNEKARSAAGFSPEWYIPLSVEHQDNQKASC